MALGKEEQVKIIVSAIDKSSGVFGSIGRSAQGLGSHLASVAATAGKAAVVLGGAFVAASAAIGKSAISSAANLEQQKIAFETLLGSADAANEAINNIKEDAKKTPFELPGLIQGNQMLISADISAEKARQTMKDLGDAISATGGGQEEMSRVIANLQQIKNVGQASAVDIKQFGFAGINMIKLLSESMGKGRDEIADMVSAGEIGFEEVSKALHKAASAGGMFEGAMERQSLTFTGIMSNIKDTWGLTLSDIATKSGLFDAVKNAANTLLSFMSDNQGVIIDFATKAIGFLGQKLQDLGNAFQTYVIPVLIEVKRQWDEQQGPIGKIHSSISRLWQLYKQFLSWEFSTIKKIISQWNDYSGTIGKIRKVIERIGSTIKNVFKENIIPFLKNLKKQWEEQEGPIGKLHKAIQKIGPFAVQAFKTVVSWLKEARRQWEEQEGPIGFIRKQYEIVKKQIVDQLVPAIQKMIASFGLNKKEGGLLAKIIGGVLVVAIRLAIQIIIALATRVAQIITFMNKFGRAVVAVHDTIVDKWSAIKATILSIIADIITGIVSFGHKIVEILSSINLFSVGANLMDGLKAGIEAHMPAVLQSASSAVKKAADAANAAGEIHSPSKLFARIGGYMIDGLIVGIQDKNPELKLAILDSVKTISDAVASIGKDDTTFSDVADQISDAFKTSLSQAFTSAQDAVANLATKFDKLNSPVKDLKSSIKDLKEEIKSVRSETKDEIQKINDDFAKNLPSALKEFRDELKETKTEIINTFESAKSQLQKSLGSDIADAIIEAQDAISKKQQEIADLQKEYAKEISDAQEDVYEKQIEYENEIADLQKKHADEQKEIEDLLALNLTKRQKDKLREQLENLKSSQSDELSELESKRNSEISDLEEKLAAIKEEKNEELKVLKEELAEERKFLKAHQADIKNYHAYILEAKRQASLDSIQITKEQYSLDLANLIANKNEEITAAIDAKNEKIKALYEEKNAAIQAAKDSRKERITELKGEISDLEDALEAAIKTRNKKMKKARKELKDELKTIKKDITGFVEDVLDKLPEVPTAITSMFANFNSAFTKVLKNLGFSKLATANTGGVVGNGGVMKFADGGVVPGPSINRDVVPALLTPGEIVINPKRGQGGMNVEVNFNNPSVRSDTDLQALAKIVQETIDRNVKLGRLGV